MKTLILTRHAKSDWGAPYTGDLDRPLNKRGRAAATAIGSWLRDEGQVPQSVLCSTARRTCETFERMGFEVPIRFTRALYHAEPEDILGVLQEATTDRVLVLGHNPGIAEFAERIVQTPPEHARFFDYPTCATLVARFNIAHWSDARWGKAACLGFVVPRDLTD